MHCEACNWNPEGRFIEVVSSPRQLSQMTKEEIAAWAEVQHFIDDGCGGRMVLDGDGSLRKVS